MRSQSVSTSCSCIPAGLDGPARCHQGAERQAELLCKLGPPLLHETPRGDDQAPAEITADLKLTNQEAGHDRLAGPGIVGEEVSQGLPWEHVLVDRGHLVGQGLDRRDRERQEWIEQVRELEALGLGDEPEEDAVAIERPCAPVHDDRQTRLVIPVQEALAQHAIALPESQLDGLVPVPSDVDNRDGISGDHAVDDRVPGQVFKASDGRPRD
jgi:hypothetical protein